MSYDKEYDSPFAKHAREFNKSYPGGKKDDITVIVAQIKLNEIMWWLLLSLIYLT